MTRFPRLEYLLTGKLPCGVTPDLDEKIEEARKAHKPVASLISERRERLHAALRGRA